MIPQNILSRKKKIELTTVKEKLWLLEGVIQIWSYIYDTRSNLHMPLGNLILFNREPSPDIS